MLKWAEQGRLPDAFLRAGIRRLLRARLSEIGDGDPSLAAERSAPRWNRTPPIRALTCTRSSSSKLR
jgi:hypothetical protein